jgi:hypothetical protein
VAVRTSPLRVVTLLPRELHRAAADALAPLATAIDQFQAPAPALGRIEGAPPDLVIADVDLVPNVSQLCLFVRSLRPDGLVLPVICYWSEREEPLRDCAGGSVLHKPPRADEWRRTLASVLDGRYTALRA